jgi:hypothetical protein
MKVTEIINPVLEGDRYLLQELLHRTVKVVEEVGREDGAGFGRITTRWTLIEFVKEVLND